MTMKISKEIKKNAFSLLELLIAIIILGILTALVIPRLQTRADEARIQAARSEMRELAKAEQNCELDTGYYVKLRVLNDIPGYSDSTTMGWRELGIKSEPYPYAIDTDGGWALIGGSYADLSNLWKGPYINFQRAEIISGDPIDPWGQPYALLTPKFIIYGETYYDYTAFPTVRKPDRFTIVSHGKDTTLGTNDDIYFSF